MLANLNVQFSFLRRLNASETSIADVSDAETKIVLSPVIKNWLRNIEFEIVFETCGNTFYIYIYIFVY